MQAEHDGWADHMTGFRLDSRLADDTFPVGDMGLSRLLLINDARFAWLVLVPRRADVREMLDLDPPDRWALRVEIDLVAEALRRTVPCDKLNIGALGNVVAQLHVHVIARVQGDAVWPKPVWAQGTAKPYEPHARDALIGQLRSTLGIA
jgi:diadenosine tetraphosphate (Ap4A) HIT family hydrolase